VSDAGPDTVELKLPPDAKYIAVVRLTVAGVASRCGMSVEDVDDLKVAVSEAFTNTIDHAYEGSEPRPVMVRMVAGPSDLRIEIIDEGAGFDVGKRSFRGEPDLSGEGGLGLYLVHQYMDDVRIESAPGSGTKVIMTKRFAR
jgi:serine/threonine-protein kinase RsbW